MNEQTEKIIDDVLRYIETLYETIPFDCNNMESGTSLQVITHDICCYLRAIGVSPQLEDFHVAKLLSDKYMVTFEPVDFANQKPGQRFHANTFVNIVTRYKHKWVEIIRVKDDLVQPEIKYHFDGELHDIVKGDHEFYLFKLRKRKFHEMMLPTMDFRQNPASEKKEFEAESCQP